MCLCPDSALSVSLCPSHNAQTAIPNWIDTPAAWTAHTRRFAANAAGKQTGMYYPIEVSSGEDPYRPE